MPENKEKKVNNNHNNHEDARIIVSSGDEKKVIDFIDFVKTSRNPLAIKLKELLNKYLREEELLAIYEEHMAGVETLDNVNATLEIILENTAMYISENNNGIKLDSRGNYLKEESKASAMSLGMADEKDYVSYDLGDELANLIGIKDINENVKYIEGFGYVEEGSFLDRMYFGDDLLANAEKDFTDFFEKSTEEMNLSEEAKKIVEEDKEIIKNSKYENDRKKYEICKIELEIERLSKDGNNSLLLEQLLIKKNKFYEENPELKGKISIRNADGSINLEEANEALEFGKAYRRSFILKHVDMFNGMSKEDFDNYDPEEKEHFFMGAIAGLGYEKDGDPKSLIVASEIKNVLKQINPELDFENEKSLLEFFGKELGMQNLAINLEQMISIISIKFEYAIDENIFNNKIRVRNGETDYTNVDFEVSNRLNHKSMFENYFENSKIKFNENDEDLYNMTYRNTTIDAWIENKEDAIKLRYMALLSVKEEYEQMPNNTYAAEKLKKINEDLGKYDKYVGKIDITPEENEYFEGYKKQFINAGIMKYLTRDAFDWQNGADYNSLEIPNKKGYIRNILAALEYSGENNVSIKKMALRRLELMNTDEKKFIVFDDKGGYTINKDEILKEYKGMSEFDYKNFGDLLDSVRFRENEYLLTKLEEYTRLRDEDFLQLPDRENPMLCMKEIDRVRVESNQERIEGKKITDDDIFSAVRKGNMIFEEVDMAENNVERVANNERASGQSNQDESGNNSTESEKKTVLEIADINTSGVTKVQPKLIDRAKDLFKRLGKKVKALIKGDGELLKLDVGEIENKTGEKKYENHISTGESTSDPWRRSATPTITDVKTTTRVSDAEITQEERE